MSETTDTALASAKKQRIRKNRIWELDFLRGFAIVMVVWDHFMYDCAMICGSLWRNGGNEVLFRWQKFAYSYLKSDLRSFWWAFFVMIFFTVSGTCTAFSKNNFVRGLKLAAVAALVSGVTYIGEYVLDLGQMFILFGVLHCLASCILIYSLAEWMVRLLNRRNRNWILPAICAALGIAALVLDEIYNIPLREVITNYTVVETDSAIAGLFVFTEDWWTADYFPLLPFIGYFLLGAAAGHILYKNKKSLLPRLDGKWHSFFTVPGRYSLIIYLSSQIVGLAVLALVSWLVLGELPL
jgi:uncharacterized membrane protein